jgi:hypothetical protein
LLPANFVLILNDLGDSERLESRFVLGSFRFVLGSFFRTFVDSKQLPRFVFAIRVLPPGGCPKPLRSRSGPVMRALSSHTASPVAGRAAVLATDGAALVFAQGSRPLRSAAGADTPTGLQILTAIVLAAWSFTFSLQLSLSAAVD